MDVSFHSWSQRLELDQLDDPSSVSPETLCCVGGGLPSALPSSPWDSLGLDQLGLFDDCFSDLLNGLQLDHLSIVRML